jgi:hypothetical protein
MAAPGSNTEKTGERNENPRLLHERLRPSGGQRQSHGLLLAGVRREMLEAS